MRNDQLLGAATSAAVFESLQTLARSTGVAALVAAVIVEIARGERSGLRHPVGPDAQPFID